MSDMVYLLSMTYNSSDAEGGCVWVDEDMERPTTSMGRAKAFDTENDASEFRATQELGLTYQITPIKATRYFKAKLKGGK